MAEVNASSHRDRLRLVGCPPKSPERSPRPSIGRPECWPTLVRWLGRTTSSQLNRSGNGIWEDEGTYQIENDDPREKYYALCMYPYPSGPAHQGHVRNYTFGDLAVRYQTMLGKGVLSPFGFDSFGLPAENAAIKTGTHPRVFTEARILELKSSLIRLGAVYDWRREVRSHDPSYMKWTQRSS